MGLDSESRKIRSTYMYGSIFNMDVKEGHEGELLDLMNGLEAPVGVLAWFVMKPDIQIEICRSGCFSR